jgi:hypothetical protein
MSLPANVRRAARLPLLALIACLLWAGAQAQSPGRYGAARDVVLRVQEDLRRAEGFTRGSEKEQERYANAQKHLSEFDRALSKGKFDKDKLDEAIEDLKNVVEKNTLSGADRDMLTEDLRALRDLRARRGR